MSPVSSAPRPSAPAAQCSTCAPAKWPPQRISVRPSPSSSVSPSQNTIAGSGRITHCAVGGVQVDGRVEGAAPLDHRRVVVRVGDGDRRRARRAPRPPRRVASSSSVMQSHSTLPAGALHQQRALADGELRLGADAEQAVALVLRARGVAWRAQLLERRPALAAPADVLPLVLADRAALPAARRSRRTACRR